MWPGYYITNLTIYVLNSWKASLIMLLTWNQRSFYFSVVCKCPLLKVNTGLVRLDPGDDSNESGKWMNDSLKPYFRAYPWHLLN